MLSETDASDLLKGFPNVEFAFAYGSGVVEQQGYDYKKTDNFPMLDIVLVVEDSETWHHENMILNPTHYSSLVPLNAKFTAIIQDKFGANFWFNAYIPMNSNRFPGRLMKYGVINRTNVLKDLETWNHLYAAGRLHKPVHILKNNTNIEAALNRNLEHALRTSLLLLPNQFSEFDLFVSVASLSYIGDPRMFIGENPKKVCDLTFICCSLILLQVVNLVTPIVHHYRNLYQSSFDKLSVEAEVVKVPQSFDVAASLSSSSGTKQFTYTQVCIKFTSSDIVFESGCRRILQRAAAGICRWACRRRFGTCLLWSELQKNCLDAYLTMISSCTGTEASTCNASLRSPRPSAQLCPQ